MGKTHQDMRLGGTSIWLGDCQSELSLDRYMMTRFSDDFGFEISGPAAPESTWGAPRPIRELLKGFSFAELFLDGALELAEEQGIEEAACALVFQAFQYDPELLTAEAIGGKLRFLGWVPPRGDTERKKRLPYSLHLAIEDGDLDKVHQAIEGGADINSLHHHGLTPLNRAARDGHLEIIETLLEQGADIHLKGKYGSPLASAIGERQVAAVRLLIEKGADVRRPRGMNNLLGAAVRKGTEEIIEILLEAGAKPNQKGLGRPSVLMMAGDNRIRGVDKARIVQLLLQYGADPTIRDKDGKTAADLLREKGEEEAAALLDAHT